MMLVPAFRCASGGFVPKAVSSETVIANGVRSPIRMEPFPVMETRQADGIASHPDIARPEVKTGVADESHVFHPIPDVGVRDFYNRSGSGSYHCGRRRGCHSHNWRTDVYPPGLHDAARNQC